MFGAVLLAALPLVIVTGLLDWIAYGPRLGQAFPRDVGWLHPPVFDWPTRPAWLFRLTQGLHVTLGIVLVPVVLGKLWSVVPKLFDWPPARSAAQVLERLSLLLLVGGILFETATGLLNIQYAYLFGSTSTPRTGTAPGSSPPPWSPMWRSSCPGWSRRCAGRASRVPRWSGPGRSRRIRTAWCPGGPARRR